MNKYIIELGEEANMVQAINVTQNGNVYVNAKYVTELKELNSDYINEHYGDLQDTAYQKGFEDGKAVHDKGCEGCKYANVAGTHEPCVRCSNSYGNQWTAKDDKIEVGDEVEWDNDFTGDRFIVTRIFQPHNMKEQCDGIDDDGDVYRAVLIESLVKTGRHFDIASILEAMKA